MTEDEMVGWYDGLNGRKTEQTLGGSEGLGSLELQSMGSQRVCGVGRSQMRSDATEQLKNNKFQI